MPNPTHPLISLDGLKQGESATIHKLSGDRTSKMRFMALGIVSGHTICLETKAPLDDPRIYSVLGYRLSIRNDDAKKILVSHP